MKRTAGHAITLAAGAALISGFTDTAASAEIPLEVYGRLPVVSSMAVSPDGDRVAFRRTENDLDAVFVVDRNSGEIIGSIDGSDTRIRSVSFLDQDRLVLFAAEALHVQDIGRKVQFSGSFIFDIRTKQLATPLKNSRHLYPLQSGTGTIVGHKLESDIVYMPAFIGETNGPPPSYGLLEVTSDNPNGRILTKGTADTVDWLVDGNGEIVAQEEYDHQRDRGRIWHWHDGDRELIYESETSKPFYTLVGLGQDSASLVVSARLPDSEYSSYFQMGFDGNVGPPLFQKEDASVEYAIVDTGRRVYGVEYSGFSPTYEFFDPALTERVRAVQAAVQNTAAELVDWTPDFRYLIFRLSGGWTSGAYVIVGPDTVKPVLLTNIRDDIPREAVAPVTMTSYTARDGLEIPALVTARADVRAAGKAPLIVLPHGGPRAHDRYEFDWFAQYFANRGIVVLQPQFRGSTGFGVSLMRAGTGQWGRAMSTDLDDGVKVLIDEGLVDPERVCMVGLSYGGYAALAAGAFSPFDYRCLVAIAGVADLPRMLVTERELYGRDSAIVASWRDLLDIEGKSASTLDDVSPVNFADRFRCPVLLVHGRKDAVVPLDQSLRMEKALKRAKKPVELVRLDGEDHHLSGYETRLQALEAVAKFIDENIRE